MGSKQTIVTMLKFCVILAKTNVLRFSFLDKEAASFSKGGI